MAEHFTDHKLGMTFLGDRGVLTALKNQAQNPDRSEKLVVTMPPGGQQGVFATGISQAIHEQDLTRGIDTIIASSAGAGSAYYLIAGADRDPATRLIAEKAGEIFTHRNPDNEMVKAQLGRTLLDIRTLAEMFRDEYPIDPEVFKRSQTRLLIGLTSWRTGQDVFFDAAKVNNPLSLVVASMMLPFGITGFPSPTIKIDGEKYVDGGISKVVPVSKVLEQKPTHYLAIAPQPLDQEDLPIISKTIFKTLVKAGLPKVWERLPDFMEGVSRDYKNLAQQAGATGEIEGVKLAVIAPTKMLNPLSMNKEELLTFQTNARQFTLNLLA